MTSKKLCIVCKKQPIRDGIRTSYCVDCNRAYGKKNYQENKERYFRLAKKRDDELDKLINDFKDKPCADCNQKYPPYVMDLDHVDPSTKEFKVSTMRRRKMAFEKIIAEMNKCEVVCANCHRERTNRQNPARYAKPQNAPGAT